MSALTLTLTDAGRAALVNAAHTGTMPVLMTHVGLSATPVSATPAATTLPGEFKRLTTFSGDVVAADTIHVTVRDEGEDTYTVRALGLYLSDGTLFALYGQANPILEKSAQAMFLLALDVIFADIEAAQLAFGDTSFLNPPATTERQGVVELATPEETVAGTDKTRAVTPHGLAALTATTKRQGIVALATEGEALEGLNQTKAMSPLSVSQVVRARLAAQPKGRNLLINAAGRVNQRGYVSATATTAANQYTLDRWRVVASGQSLVFMASGPSFQMTAPAGGVEQVVEGVNIADGTYTLSWSGTATATINGTPVANGGQIALPGGVHATVRFSGGTVLNPKLEQGVFATPFELPDLAEEFAACLRYYEVGPTVAEWYFRSTTQARFSATYKVPKRAQATIRLPGGSGFFAQLNEHAFASALNYSLGAVSLVPFLNTRMAFAADVTCTAAGQVSGWLHVFRGSGNDQLWAADAEL